jgi:hypothetical protein
VETSVAYTLFIKLHWNPRTFSVLLSGNTASQLSQRTAARPPIAGADSTTLLSVPPSSSRLREQRLSHRYANRFDHRISLPPSVSLLWEHSSDHRQQEPTCREMSYAYRPLANKTSFSGPRNIHVIVAPCVDIDTHITLERCETARRAERLSYLVCIVDDFTECPGSTEDGWLCG